MGGGGRQHLCPPPSITASADCTSHCINANENYVIMMGYVSVFANILMCSCLTHNAIVVNNNVLVIYCSSV